MTDSLIFIMDELVLSFESLIAFRNTQAAEVQTKCSYGYLEHMKQEIEIIKILYVLPRPQRTQHKEDKSITGERFFFFLNEIWGTR